MFQSFSILATTTLSFHCHTLSRFTTQPFTNQLHSTSTMPGTGFSDLPVELLEKIFEHLVVLKPGSFFQDPGSADSSIQKPLANYEARVARTPRDEPYGRQLVLEGAKDWQLSELISYSQLKPVDTSDLPTPPAEYHPAILSVCKHFYSVAVGMLYSRNDFLFRTPEALNAFVARVNGSTPSGICLYPRVGTKAIRRLFLHRKHFRTANPDVENTTRWIEYLQSQPLVQDFPNLRFLDINICSLGRGYTLWLNRRSDQVFVHPIFRESMLKEMKYFDKNGQYFACGVPEGGSVIPAAVSSVGYFLEVSLVL